MQNPNLCFERSSTTLDVFISLHSLEGSIFNKTNATYIVLEEYHVLEKLPTLAKTN